MYFTALYVKKTEARITKFGEHGDVEAPWSGTDFCVQNVKEGQVYITMGGEVTLITALYQYSLDGAADHTNIAMDGSGCCRF